MAAAPLQGAMSLFNTFLPQHPTLGGQQKAPKFTQQKPLPRAPTAPISITQPSGNKRDAIVEPNNATLGTSPPVNSTGDLCESCHIRTKAVEGTKTHDFCSKRCAATYKNTRANGANAPASRDSSKARAPAPGNCDFCHVRPKYNDGTQTLSFCGRTCANSFANKNPTAAKQGTTPSKNQCKIAGCPQPRQYLGHGKLTMYCSSAHQTLGETVCIMCRSNPKQGDRHYCGKTCAEDAANKGPTILEVPEGHVTFNSVAEQFKTSWRHPNKPCPPVKGVYKIVGSKESLVKFDAYRDMIEARGNFRASGRSAGNENRRWHGTRRECKLGDSGYTKFCKSKTCSLCCIVKTSFDLSLFGKKTGWGRFGCGIYTSSTASKSDDYSSNKKDNPSSYKAILLNKVIVGKGYKVEENNTSLTEPPKGYDSVLAEKGKKLNYDETVVYKNEAIRPSFLVMYEAY